MALNLVRCAMALRQTYEIEMMKHRTSDTKRLIDIQKVGSFVDVVINRQANAIYSYSFSFTRHMSLENEHLS